MQHASATYREIFNSGSYYVETRVYVGDIPANANIDTLLDGETNVLLESDIISMKTSKRVFSESRLQVGCCTCGEIDIELYKPSFEIGRSARLSVFIRLVAEDEEGGFDDEEEEEEEEEEEPTVSEWIRKGVFFIDTRSITSNDDELDIITLHGYDSMLKAEQNYGDSTLEFPTTDILMINDVASRLGVELDERCTKYINNAYTVKYPSEYTLREILSYIGCMYAGNWIINDLGKLQLIPIWALQKESSLLTDEIGNHLTFGADFQFPLEDVAIKV